MQCILPMVRHMKLTIHAISPSVGQPNRQMPDGCAVSAVPNVLNQSCEQKNIVTSAQPARPRRPCYICVHLCLSVQNSFHFRLEHLDCFFNLPIVAGDEV